MRVDTELATPSSVLGMKGFELHNRALQSEHSGDLVEAERLFLEAIRLKGLHFGLDHWKTATSMNDLGELYLKAGRLDEAEQRLNEANTIRRRLGPEHTFDAAVTREYLAQLSEARGDLDRARTMRQSGGPEKMVCSNSKCPGQLYKLSALSACGACKSAFYCSGSCQKQDWKRHKTPCKKAKAGQ